MGPDVSRLLIDRARIREIALENKFTLREQAGGNLDLNEYVYDFALAVSKEYARNYAKDLRDEIERIHDCITCIEKEVKELKKTDWKALGFR